MAQGEYQLSHTAQEVDNTIDQAVRFVSQSLTAAQKAQARSNIDADLTADDYLTDAEIEEILGSDIFWDGTVE